MGESRTLGFIACGIGIAIILIIVPFTFGLSLLLLPYPLVFIWMLKHSSRQEKMLRYLKIIAYNTGMQEPDTEVVRK